MMKGVVTFADGAGNYAKAMMRLELSLKQIGFDGLYAGYNDYAHIGSPRHKGISEAVPYAFKPYSIKKFSERARYILWCDSVVYATKKIDAVFEHIQREGYLLFNNLGFSLSEYTSDACLNKFGIDRNEGYSIPMVMAACMGIDMEHPIGKEFFKQYFEAANDGVSYHGDWVNNDLQVSQDMRCHGHRHDQSVASCIAHNLGMNLTPYHETYFAYVEHKGRLQIAETVCLWSQGL
jgi:hypothetical protein